MKKILLTSLLLLFSFSLVACNKSEEEITIDENDIEEINQEEMDKELLTDDDFDKLSKEFPNASKEEIANINTTIKDIYYIGSRLKFDIGELVSNRCDEPRKAIYTIEYTILKGEVLKDVFEDILETMKEYKSQHDLEYVKRKEVEGKMNYTMEYPDIDEKYHDKLIEYLDDYYNDYYSIVNNNFELLYGEK